MSFGQLIMDARKCQGLTQKEVAARIQKEDGSPISPQYLNDLERDRRNPPSPHFLRQFADVLRIDYETLVFAAGQYPEDLAYHAEPPERVQAAFKAFRRELKGP